MRSFLVFVLSLVFTQGIFLGPRKQIIQARFSIEKWLKAYDIVNITVKYVTSEFPPGKVALYLQFSYKSNNFTIGLVKIDTLPKSTVINIDGYVTNTTQVSERINLFQGSTYGNNLYVKCTALLTNGGLDAMFKIGNESLIIEPVQRFNFYSPKHKFSERECKTVEEFSCIMYKPEDILDKSNISHTLNDEVISKHALGLKDVNARSRQKRATYYSDCTLHIVADHTFYKQAGEEDITTTISEMLYFVTEANTVFRSTDFDGDGSGDNVGFYVSQISIFTNEVHYKMSDTSLTVYKYLDAFSEYDLSNVCLGIAFSSRDFSDGVLGLAWVASSSTYGAAGGICQRRVFFQNKHYSLNTNIISVVNNGERIPAYKSALTLTHEFGHSFGSPHDSIEDASCVPNNEFGNYIMYPYANDGSKPNHNQFSPCSIGYMFPVITNKGACFESSVGVCGNGIKEEHEECDCGSSDVCDLLDPSCTPSDVSPSSPDPPCSVRRTSGCQCSIVSSPCCTPSCQFSQSDKICRYGGECVKPTYCSGTSAECLQIAFEPDDKRCHGNKKTCRSGKCIGSICSLFNSTECDCSPGLYECHICCLINSIQCAPAMLNGTTVTKSVGSACRQMSGFCDKHAACLLQDPDSVVKRLNEVFSPKSMNEVATWLQNHWYYVITGIAGLTFIAAIFYATCRRRMDVQTSAFMYGQFMRIKRESEIQKQYIEERKKLIKSKYETEKDKIETGTKRMRLTKAAARLKVFFPTAPSRELEKVLKMSSKEEMAVTLLLMKGFPLRRISSSI